MTVTNKQINARLRKTSEVLASLSCVLDFGYGNENICPGILRTLSFTLLEGSVYMNFTLLLFRIDSNYDNLSILCMVFFPR